MYDIAIIGAGPAGSAFARLAPRHLKIALIDKRNLDEDKNFMREKCCGGLLAPAAQKELAQQGIGVPEEILTGPQTFSVKSIDLDNNLLRFYQRHYINIDREKFDRWLVSLVPDNVDKFFNCLFISSSKQDGKYIIKAKDIIDVKTIEAKTIVAADGAASFVRSRIAPDYPVPLKYVSIQDTYSTKKCLPYYFSIFDKGTTDFYSWMIQKGETVLYGSAVPWGEDVISKHEKLAAKLVSTGSLEGPVIKRNGAIIYRPKGNKGILLSKDNVFFIGEASGMISPSSAEGISYALKSGRKLAEAYSQETDIERTYINKMIPMRLNILYKNIKAWVMYSKILRRAVMKTGIMSIDVKEEQ